MKKFEFEKAEGLFLSKLNGRLVNVDEFGFGREFEFDALGETYKVIWYHNQSTLIAGNVRVMFFDAEISNTWPSPAGAKRKLQLRDANGNTISVMVLEWYE